MQKKSLCGPIIKYVSSKLLFYIRLVLVRIRLPPGVNRHLFDADPDPDLDPAYRIKKDVDLHHWFSDPTILGLRVLL
jgi:hypothetical protein